MAVISSLPQPLVAVPAYLFVEWFTFLLPIGLGCAAGTMIWMVFAELIPDGLVFYLPCLWPRGLPRLHSLHAASLRGLKTKVWRRSGHAHVHQPPSASSSVRVLAPPHPRVPHRSHAPRPHVYAYLVFSAGMSIAPVRHTPFAIGRQHASACTGIAQDEVVLNGVCDAQTAIKTTEAHTIATVLTLALIFQVALQSIIETSL